MDPNDFLITPRWIRAGLAVVLIAISALFALQWIGILPAFTGKHATLDPMYKTGFLTILPALLLSLRVERDFMRTMMQIDDDRLIDHPSRTLHEVHADIRRRVRRWQWSGALSVGAAVTAGYYMFYIHGLLKATLACRRPDGGCVPNWPELVAQDVQWLLERAPFLVISILLGLIVGHRLGTMSGTASIARVLTRPELQVTILPDHPDGIGGFRRLGALVALQGTLASIPVIWLGAWLVLLSFNLEQFAPYRAWNIPFLIQILVALTFLSLCFLVPFLQLTRRYNAEKTALTRYWRDRLRSTTAAAGQDGAGRASDELKMLESLRSLPTFPVTPQLSKLFSVSTATPFFMLALSIAMPDQVAPELKSVIEGLIGWL